MAVAQFGDVEFGESEFGESLLGTLTTPTIILTANTTDSRIEIAVTNSGTVPDYNEIWRFKSGESAIRITATLPANGVFYDYNVASAITYFYFARAVTVGGDSLDSATSSTSVTLTVTRLHTVAKNAANNIDSTYGLLTLPLTAPVGRPNNREDRVFVEPARTKPVIATSDIVSRGYNGILMFTGFPSTTLDTLISMYEQNEVYCVRDVDSHLLFGTLPSLPVSYQHTYAQVELNLEQTDYIEAV